MPKKFSKKIFIFLLLLIQTFSLLFFVFIPKMVKADASVPQWQNPFDKLQIKIPGMQKFSEVAPCPDDPDKKCVKWISEYIAGLYQYAIGIVGILAAVVLMIGGIIWLTAGGNQTRIGTAKSYIGGSIAGLVIALSSYLILYQINPELIKLKPIKVTQVKGIPTATTTLATTGLSEQQASSFLSSAWIGWDKCKAGEPPGCAQLNGIKQSTLSEIDQLAHSCPLCGTDNFYITSGTEGSGHADGVYSHGSGYKVDLRLNAPLTNFIKTNYTNKGVRSDGAIMYQNSRGACYALESDHWDVKVAGNGCP